MADSEEDIKGELIKASVEVVKTAYDDALKPVASETGKALGTLGRSVNAALAPLRGLVWSWEAIEGWLKSTVEAKLAARGVPEDKVTTPDPDVAVPAIEALRYTKLKEEYANLLATSMNTETAHDAHPSFVEILKQLTPDEAKILKFLPQFGRQEPIMNLGYKLPQKGQFTICQHVSTIGEDAGCESGRSVPQSLDNLTRLGLTEIPAMRALAEDHRYSRIRALPVVDEVKKLIPEGGTFFEEKCIVGLTILGDGFRKACIDDQLQNKA